MKFSGFCKFLVLAGGFVALYASFSAVAMTTSSTTTVTSPEGIPTETTSSTIMPGGANLTCTSSISGGVSSMMTSTITIPNSFMSGFTGQVFNFVGRAMGVNKLVSKLADQISGKASEFCNRLSPLLTDDSGEASAAQTRMEQIVGDNSEYVGDLMAISAQMQALGSSFTGDPDQAVTVMAEFESLTNQQLSILEVMNADMDQLNTDYAQTRKQPVPGSGVIGGSLPSCEDVIFVDPLNPTTEEINIASSYMYCETNATGVCCVRNCDATLNFATPNAPTESELDVFDSYERCLPLSGDHDSGYCCFL